MNMVLVVNGGVGKAFDELAMNFAVCEAAEAKVAGVLVRSSAAVGSSCALASVPGGGGSWGPHISRSDCACTMRREVCSKPNVQSYHVISSPPLFFGRRPQLNKVKPSKLEMVRDYFGRAVESRFGLPLVGCVGASS